jgi:hypothetical protein
MALNPQRWLQHEGQLLLQPVIGDLLRIQMSGDLSNIEMKLNQVCQNGCSARLHQVISMEGSFVMCCHNIMDHADDKGSAVLARDIFDAPPQNNKAQQTL